MIVSNTTPCLFLKIGRFEVWYDCKCKERGNYDLPGCVLPEQAV